MIYPAPSSRTSEGKKFSFIHKETKKNEMDYR